MNYTHIHKLLIYLYVAALHQLDKRRTTILIKHDIAIHIIMRIRCSAGFSNAFTGQI